jgi:GTP-binding protein
MRFIDEVEITCISGKGGSGGISFRREAREPRGGPDGGDGGRGGNVILRATVSKNTLDHLRGRRVYSAQGGVPGSPKNKHGKSGEDFLVEVPMGTILIDVEEGLVVADLVEDGATAIVCRGGKGGRGNARFSTSANRSPRIADDGGPAVTRVLKLELKLLADVGLLGFPNAGKSTLISSISGARPKVADYPFTTLVPNLGVVRVDDDLSFVLADIPGLIQGASEGLGLGHRFLKHVERCRFLLHLVSVDDQTEDVKEPLERYRLLQQEVEAFSPELKDREQIIVLSKVDLVDEAHRDLLVRAFEKETACQVLCISSATRQGLDTLKKACAKRLHDMLLQEEEDCEEPRLLP